MILSQRKHAKAYLRPIHTFVQSRADLGLAQDDRLHETVPWLIAPVRSLLVDRLPRRPRQSLAFVIQQSKYSQFTLTNPSGAREAVCPQPMAIRSGSPHTG